MKRSCSGKLFNCSRLSGSGRILKKRQRYFESFAARKKMPYQINDLSAKYAYFCRYRSNITPWNQNARAHFRSIKLALLSLNRYAAIITIMESLRYSTVECCCSLFSNYVCIVWRRIYVHWSHLHFPRVDISRTLKKGKEHSSGQQKSHNAHNNKAVTIA